ncbi:SRPBCC family protein [Aldersonia sp. NBC_00410]|uniref:SRPBCC family protein n=1 Tax=Aldersonia sp. NBC_00410 TaxID=2975954 RepID=UPI002258EC66|nr:SRPBCC family protein [Aldersonia sp. NBC_00410]MCX5044270.1 SRPBCC family protein [Aldersonia sp. NBC_00410]
MKIENAFSIPVPAEDAWRVLLDLERIAPCVPGATITSRDGDDFHGKMKVKLGPVGLNYGGIIKIKSKDEEAKVAVLEGGGREARGNGTAKALMTFRLVESGDSTEVFVDTDLDITGKPAQFGRGALTEVAGTIIGQFATNLAAELSASVDAGAPAAGGAAQPETKGDESNGAAASNGASPKSDPAPFKAAAPIDILEAAGVGGLKKAAPPVVVLLIVAVLLLVWRNRAQQSGR